VSVRGLPVGVAVRSAFENLQGRPDLRFGPLQDRIPSRPGPGRERLAQVTLTGVLGGERLALPVGEAFGERAVRGGQVRDPLAYLARRLSLGQGELGPLAFGGGFGFSRAERGELLIRVAAGVFTPGHRGELAGRVRFELAGGRRGGGGGLPAGRR